MKELSIHEIASVNGASYGDIFCALTPLAIVTAKGLLACYELNKNPASIIPAVSVVALFSAVGAVAGYLYNDNAAIGSATGGITGALTIILLRIDVLK